MSNPLDDFELAALNAEFTARGTDALRMLRDEFKSFVADIAQDGIINADDTPDSLAFMTFDAGHTGTPLLMADKEGRRMALAHAARSITGAMVAQESGDLRWPLFAAYAASLLLALRAELLGALAQRHLGTKKARDTKAEKAESDDGKYAKLREYAEAHRRTGRKKTWVVATAKRQGIVKSESYAYTKLTEWYPGKAWEEK